MLRPQQKRNWVASNQLCIATLCRRPQHPPSWSKGKLPLSGGVGLNCFTPPCASPMLSGASAAGCEVAQSSTHTMLIVPSDNFALVRHSQPSTPVYGSVALQCWFTLCPPSCIRSARLPIASICIMSIRAGVQCTSCMLLLQLNCN